ncbi:protoporphyrinogen/coproporphyrinogen oxidase [Actinomyces wuliandei]|uniref:protoporphyrinogen/coproporphyrinogen oxidase n=1 Tax=Actinomyces wuliandei TaxID=2057743 RepID=UPI00242B002C|nr:NAD(P)-binding protein [Actinomyces wuliandei]
MSAPARPGRQGAQDREQDWDAVVVGGGMAGLSAAWELARAGLRPLLVEARGYTGGLVAGASVAGVRIDLGAEGFATRADSPLGVTATARELGLTTVSPSGRPHLFLPPVAGGATPPRDVPTGTAPPTADEGAPSAQPWGLHPFPANAFLGIPADPGSPDVVSVIGTEAAALAARDRDLPAFVGTRPQDPGDLASFVRTRMGQGVLDRLVRPVVAGIHSADPGVLATDTVAPGLREATARLGGLGAAVAELVEHRRRSGRRGGDATVEGGLFLLTDALRHAIEAAGGRTETRTGAQWLRQEAPGRWTLAVSDTQRGPSPSDEPTPVGPQRLLRTARVVLACSPGAALRLLEGAPGVDTDVEVPCGTSLARLVLVVRAPGLDDAPTGSGLLVAPGAEPPGGSPSCPVRAKALSHLSAKWPWVGRQLRERHGPGTHALRLSYGRPGRPRPEVDREDALEDASTLTGTRLDPSAVLDHVLARWDGTLPPPTPTYRRRTARLEEEVARLEGLVVTGAWVAGTGIAAIVPHARAAAGRLVPLNRT